MTAVLDIGDEVEALHGGEWKLGTIVHWSGTGFEHPVVLLDTYEKPLLRPELRPVEDA